MSGSRFRRKWLSALRKHSGWIWRRFSGFSTRMTLLLREGAGAIEVRRYKEANAKRRRAA
jgi:hypothetical protein